MRAGLCGVFLGYADAPPDAAPVFERGDLCVVVAPDEDEGVFRCAAISTSGEVAHWRTDTLFAEELIWVNQSPLVVADGPGRRA